MGEYSINRALNGILASEDPRVVVFSETRPEYNWSLPKVDQPAEPLGFVSLREALQTEYELTPAAACQAIAARMRQATRERYRVQ